MDNRWQAMDSGAVPTRSVSEHPLSLHRRPAATRRRRPWHRTTAHHALSFQRGNAVRMPAPGRRLKIGSPAIGRARYSLPSGAAKPGAIPPRPPACRGGGLGAGTPKTGPARTRRSHAVTHRAILQDRQSKGTPTRSVCLFSDSYMASRTQPGRRPICDDACRQQTIKSNEQGLEIARPHPARRPSRCERVHLGVYCHWRVGFGTDRSEMTCSPRCPAWMRSRSCDHALDHRGDRTPWNRRRQIDWQGLFSATGSGAGRPCQISMESRFLCGWVAVHPQCGRRDHEPH
jgi:hypothetical protein